MKRQKKKKWNFFSIYTFCIIIQFWVSVFICYFIMISCRPNSSRPTVALYSFIQRAVRVLAAAAGTSIIRCSRFRIFQILIVWCVLLVFCYFITYSWDYKISVVTRHNVLLLRHHNIRHALLTRKKKKKKERENKNNNKNNSNNIMSSNKNDITYRRVEKKKLLRRIKEQGFSVSGNDIKRVVCTY